MANLNNQNYCLQKELEDFVDADEAVKRNLDRKHKVEHIRHRVDDVIRRSQVEVEHRAAWEARRPAPVPPPAEVRYASRSAHLSHSPIREPLGPRVAWARPEDPRHEPGPRFGGPDMRRTEASTRYNAGGNWRSSVSPLRKDDFNSTAAHDRTRSGNGKAVSFASATGTRGGNLQDKKE